MNYNAKDDHGVLIIIVDQMVAAPNIINSHHDVHTFFEILSALNIVALIPYGPLKEWDRVHAEADDYQV